MHPSTSKATKKDAVRKTNWAVTSKYEESHGKPIYGCLMNPYTPEDSNPIFLTVADRFMHFYELPSDSTAVNLIGAIECASENLFTAAWCFDTFEASKGKNPYMAVGGGVSGDILVIDAIKLKIVNILTGSGQPINEIRTSPTDSNMFASASADRTVRVFHIRQNCPLLILGGPESHHDQILSLDWSSDGQHIVSSGMDHCILKWDTHQDKRSTWILANARKKLASGNRNILISPQDDSFTTFKKRTEEEKIDNQTAMEMRTKSSDGYFQYQPDKRDDAYIEVVNKLAEYPYAYGETFYQVFYPAARNIDIHLDYVDCVRYVGDSQYIVSKGSGNEALIRLSRFGSPGKKIKDIQIACQEDSVGVNLHTKTVPEGETWFIKFDIDANLNYLACGNYKGEIAFFEMSNITDTKPCAIITCTDAPIRQVAFSIDGRTLIGVGENGKLVRLDYGLKNQKSLQHPTNTETTLISQAKVKLPSALNDLSCYPPKEDGKENNNMLPLLRPR